MEPERDKVGALEDRVGALEVGASKLTRLVPWEVQVGAWKVTGWSLGD